MLTKHYLLHHYLYIYVSLHLSDGEYTETPVSMYFNTKHCVPLRITPTGPSKKERVYHAPAHSGLDPLSNQDTLITCTDHPTFDWPIRHPWLFLPKAQRVRVTFYPKTGSARADQNWIAQLGVEDSWVRMCALTTRLTRPWLSYWTIIDLE